jgi:pimeloyl-ACP methyl ester carboxylesterase
MSGYAFIQDTKPQTLSYGLTDSPVGQALWIFEKFQEWTDNHGNATDALSMDPMLDNITLYWMTQTAGSAAKLYKESFKKDFVRIAISLPTAITVFKGDIFTPPKVWAERTYSNLIYWNEIANGGHFAAFEQPLSLAKELRISMRTFRKSGL